MYIWFGMYTKKYIMIVQLATLHLTRITHHTCRLTSDWISAGNLRLFSLHHIPYSKKIISYNLACGHLIICSKYVSHDPPFDMYIRLRSKVLKQPFLGTELVKSRGMHIGGQESHLQMLSYVRRRSEPVLCLFLVISCSLRFHLR